MLAGLLFDDRGNALSPSHAVKRGKRYRYYVSQALLRDEPEGAGAIARIPAGEIESVVVDAIKAHIIDPAFVLDQLMVKGASAREQQRLLTGAERLAQELSQKTVSQLRSLLMGIATRVVVGAEQINLRLSSRALKASLLEEASKPAPGERTTEHQSPSDDDMLELIVPARLKARSGELRLIVPPDVIGSQRPRPNDALIKAVRRTWNWKQRLMNEEGMTLRGIAEDETVSDRYIGNIIHLAFLAPDIVEAILTGRQPRDLELRHMLTDIPLDWDEQRRRFGFQR